MVEHRVALVDVALLALDGVALVGAALGDEVGGDEVAAGGEDAECEAGDDAGKGRGQDHACLDALV